VSQFILRAFKTVDGDPLAPEHERVRQLTEEALQKLGPTHSYEVFPVKESAAGQSILESQGEQSRRYALAAILQTTHWDLEAARIRAEGKNEIERANPHFLPGWAEIWGRRRQTHEIIVSLLRRALPFTEADLITLLEWIVVQHQLSTYHVPVAAIARAAERFSRAEKLSPSLEDAIRRAAAKLRTSYDKDAKRCATTLEQLCAAEISQGQTQTPEHRRPVIPGPAGDPAVLSELKRSMGMVSGDTAKTVTREIEPDRFRLCDDSPLIAEHALLTKLFAEAVGKAGYAAPNLSVLAAGRTIAHMTASARGKLLLAACERAVSSLTTTVDHGTPAVWQSRHTAAACVERIGSLDCSLSRGEMFDFLLYFAVRASHARAGFGTLFAQLLAQLAQAQPFSDGERFVLSLVRGSFIQGPPLGSPSEKVQRFAALIGDGAQFFVIPSERWSVMLNDEISALPLDQRTAWVDLLSHCLTATTARPSGKWLKTAQMLTAAVGIPKVRASLLRWFSQVPGGRTARSLALYPGDARTTSDIIQEENAFILRGLLWIAPDLEGGDEMTRAVSVVAQSAYKKVPGVGPRAVKVGNAALYALSQISSPAAVGQLAMLKVRVRFGSAQKEIEKAFNATADALKIPRDQIEEMGVPTYGLEEVGVRRETFGDASAELRVDGRDVTILWTSAGKPVKSVPSKVKTDHNEDFKELQGAAKDIAAMLPAQSERLDAMFLLQKRWPVALWQERYLDHPLVGTLARRLIWASGGAAFIWCEGKFVDQNDSPIKLAAEAEISLWHPIDRPVEEVVGWRASIERHEVRQPFKQAHREVYLVTDAERRTATYSNRFAAHILRQHQFNALCAARGWKNKLRLMVDADYPPAYRELPNWALRAEFWIEGIGDGYGADTNESGAYLRLATDQVRFYRTGAAHNHAHAGGGGYSTAAAGPGTGSVNDPLPLDQVPPLVLSEILRDVDLFVGVASVGNDPAWQDGGPGGRYREYWHTYSFGELSETAQTRKAVLQTLLPRLTKLKDRWSLNDKFLVIRGDLRTYKIHLGSGNILMEPNDQYLCIVPDRSSKGGETVLLPFEGDATLSIILSKAFLLALDNKITDSSIKHQILR
jgi:hypothetical protein